MIRVIPDIPRIRAHWDRRSMEIPTRLEVPMSDGKVVRYVPDVKQPGFVKAMENLRSMKIGYERKEE